MPDFWSHDALTGGKPVAILPLNIAGEKAALAKKIEIAKRGDAVPAVAKLSDSLAGIELLEVVIYHTLKRMCDVTPDDVAKHLDAPSAAALAGLIAKANGWSDPKAQSTASPPQSPA